METRKTLLVLSLLTFVSMGVFAQESTRQWSENGRFGIGVGYNFRNVPRSAKAMRPMEFSLKYSINERHSLYVTVPLYIKDKDQEYKYVPEYIGTYKKQELYGVGIGYNYHFLHQKNFSEFCGIGFNYFHTKNIIEHSWNTNEISRTDHSKQDIYALSPQFGADYRYQHFRMEFKYIYYLSRRKTSNISEVDGKFQTEYATHDNENVLLKGLSLSLSYYF
jgi:hypothetical protein